MRLVNAYRLFTISIPEKYIQIFGTVSMSIRFVKRTFYMEFSYTFSSTLHSLILCSVVSTYIQFFRAGSFYVQSHSTFSNPTPGHPMFSLAMFSLPTFPISTFTTEL
jgi:hypothetical protein